MNQIQQQLKQLNKTKNEILKIIGKPKGDSNPINAGKAHNARELELIERKRYKKIYNWLSVFSL